MIYARLQGRAGNQFFQYYFGKRLEMEYNDNLVLDFYKVNRKNWSKDILKFNVDFFSLLEDKFTYFKNMNILQLLVVLIYRLFTPRNASYQKIYMYEIKWQPFLDFMGIYWLSNGYYEYAFKCPFKNKFINGYYEDRRYFDNYILSTLSAAFWFILLNFGNFFERISGVDKKYINCMVVYLIFLPAINMFQARERYYFKYKMSVLISTVVSVGTALLSVVLVVFFENKLSGRILGSAIPTVFIGIIIYIYIWKQGKRVNLDDWKYALPICVPYIPHLLSLTILNSMDRIMITNICGSEENALYSLAYTCGSMITILIGSMNSAFAPWLGEMLSENKLKEIQVVSKKYISAFFYLAIGIMLFAPEILLLFGGKSYMEAIYVMTPVSMGCVCQFLYTLFVNVEQFKKKTIGMACASITAAVINFILNWIFIPKFGYLAAAYTTLVGYLCLLLIHMFLVKRIKLNNVYSYKFVREVVILGIAAMVIITLLYSHAILRYIFIGIYGGTFIIILRNSSEIKGYFNRKKRGGF